MKIIELFEMASAKSKSKDDYSTGQIPFVTNTEVNNGVVAYVEPFETDIVFAGPAICISGLGHATVHLDSFLPKGNGGDSCTVLTPKGVISNNELLYYAALFNTLHGWRFSFGRKAGKRRLESLELLPTYANSPIVMDSLTCENNQLMASLLSEKDQQFRV
ncbi:restriction endonuclease subunit S [Vibrio vulnificus]|uniref:restriction endonuclease subunit S n=1 Tax=Vibrio vulnificus TaxID=672 RepID=UPI003ED96DD8